MVGPYHLVTVKYQLVSEMVPDNFGWFRFVFSKQNNESFQIFPGSMRGARTCLLAGTGGRSPTAMLLEPGAKAAFLHIALDLLNPLRKQQIRRAVSNFVYQFVIENASASVNRLDPWRRNGKRDRDGPNVGPTARHVRNDCPFGQHTWISLSAETLAPA